MYTPVNVERGIGWIVGFRTIQNGEMVNEYDGPFGDGGGYWKASGYVRCALVSMSPYQNPIKVPMDGFEVIE